LKAATLAVLLAIVLAACAAGRASEPEWLPPTPEARSDFALFAIRCSKCHSLARPLNSGIDDDYYWKMYVARMRRQPGSGISAQDTVAILRFLHLYSIEQRRKEAASLDTAEPPSVDAGAPPTPDAPGGP
jgi:hypothetical protein